jgi:hypothetical protein
MYWELSRLRLSRNQLALVEPNGTERFDQEVAREPEPAPHDGQNAKDTKDAKDGRSGLRTAS